MDCTVFAPHQNTIGNPNEKNQLTIISGNKLRELLNSRTPVCGIIKDVMCIFRHKTVFRIYFYFLKN